MTQNQIAYHNAIENERHNKAMENETKRHALIDEAIRQRQNELSEYSTTITKEHYERADAINAQHYQRQDTLNELIASETQRANIASEAIRQRQNAINAANVSETARHAKAMEAIESSLMKNTLYKTQAEVSYTNANTGFVQAKTRTEGYQPQYVLNQTDLARAKTITEKYQQDESEARVTKGYIDSIVNAVRVIFPGFSSSGK